MNLLTKTPFIKSFVSKPQPQALCISSERINRNRTMSTRPKKTFKMLASTVFQGAKRCFSLDDPLRLKKYFYDDHLEAFAVAQRFALELVGQSHLVSIKDFSKFAETVIGVAREQAYRGSSLFRAALIKKINNWLKKKEEEPKAIGLKWYRLSSSKPDRLKYLVPLFGVTKSRYISDEFIGDYTMLLVKGCAEKEGKLVPVEIKVQLPSEYNFKPAEVCRSFDKEHGVVLVHIRGFKVK